MDRIFTVHYLGSSELDKRYTQSMLPWVIAEVRRRHDIQSLCLQIKGDKLEARLGNEEIFFIHELNNLFRFAQIHQDKTLFAYLYRLNAHEHFVCHVYQAESRTIVSIAIENRKK